MPTDTPSYWHKQTSAAPFYPDMQWHLPERPAGTLAIIGGASSGFQAVVRTAEFARQNLPLATAHLVVPASLEPILSSVEDVTYAPANPAGAFRQSDILTQLTADATLYIGDLSKNTEAAAAIAQSAAQAAGPRVLARDAIDALTPQATALLTLPDLTLLASLAQLQKLFRTVYYPKMLMLTAPLLNVVECLHKFTLSYPVTILTLHEGQILVAAGGEIVTTPLSETIYSPLSLWSGELAATVAAYQIFCPEKPLAATAAAILA